MMGIESLLNEINFEMDRLTSIVSQIRDNKRVENYQRQEEEYRLIQEQRMRDEIIRNKENEERSIREKRFTIIGSIFAFFTVFETLWNIAILTDIAHIISINLNEKLVYFTFVNISIIISIIIGTIVYNLWSRNSTGNKEND